MPIRPASPHVCPLYSPDKQGSSIVGLAVVGLSVGEKVGIELGRKDGSLLGDLVGGTYVVIEDSSVHELAEIAHSISILGSPMDGRESYIAQI